jgi:arginyl-tRNA synthetase
MTHGEQINRFAKSLVAAAHDEPTPVDGYKGAYIDEIARRVIVEANAEGIDILNLPRVDGGTDEKGEPLGEGDSEQREEFRKRAVPMMFDEIRQSMKEFRVHFDVWFHENSLYEDGEVEKAIADLRNAGDIYEKDGATWFESTEHGDDKDRVIIKSDGTYAYFAADIAYYRNKRHRKTDPADVAIYMLGADHHGYIGRMMAMCAAFGDKPGENMQILIGQMVNVMKDGKPVRMSKRAGQHRDDRRPHRRDWRGRIPLFTGPHRLQFAGRHRPQSARLAFERQSGVLCAVCARPLVQRRPQCRSRANQCRRRRSLAARH